ncbi:MAG TPA: NAD(P)/FAD-dependent oxidoreductase, partial [Candidatus Limnocylindrales bacterium]|nr:NAD(P)/FAD-dependent oxidoreductase [Candidatus Limnocylindrales bacterium]
MEPRRFDVLLVGGGLAAVRCARALRRGGLAASIAIVGDEPVPPYNRPPLSKELLREQIPLELVLAESRSWYERRGVELLLGTPATRLDPVERLVELADGRRLRYGDCLLATGAEPRRPAIPGAQDVLLLRTLAEAEALRDRARPGQRAVVIGGGFIGVEAAASLAARGLAVTVLERGRSLWGGSLGPAVSEWATRRLTAAGVELRFDATVSAVAADGVMVDGDRVGADITLAGVGVRPLSGLAEGAGLEVADGVLVDSGQRVAPHLFAAGDVARPRDADRVEHWHAAR